MGVLLNMIISENHVKRDMMAGEELTLYILKYGHPETQIFAKDNFDRPVGNLRYTDYIITNKRKEDVNWDE